MQNAGTATNRAGEVTVVTAAGAGLLAGGPLDPPAAAGAIAAGAVGGVIRFIGGVISAGGAVLQFSADLNLMSLGRNLLGALTPGSGLAGVAKSETVSAANQAVDNLTGAGQCSRGN